MLSGGFSFKLDISALGLYGALVPQWVEPSELAQRLPRLGRVAATPGTWLWLPLREGAGAPHVSPPSPLALLFLRRLATIEYRAVGGGGVRLRRLGGAAAPLDLARAEGREGAGGAEGAEGAEGREGAEGAEGAGGGGDAERPARAEEATVVTETLDGVPPPCTLLPCYPATLVTETLDGVPGRALRFRVWREAGAVRGKRTELALAFPCDPPEEPLPLFAWLPVTTSVGLPFALHADWELVASRQALHAGSEWNAALRDAGVAVTCPLHARYTPVTCP